MENDKDAEYPPLRIIDAQVDRLEAEIDVMNDKLEPLRSFILPGGSALAAKLHVCRTVARRAERLCVELATMEEINPAAVKYLNRLSDWFFVAGRIANNNGVDDVLGCLARTVSAIILRNATFFCKGVTILPYYTAEQTYI